MTNEISILHPLVSETLERYGIAHEAIACDPGLADTTAFCEAYGFTAGETCNAIIAAGKATPTKYACCVVLANCKVDVNKKVCELLEVKKCSFASGDQTLEVSGMQIGGVTPVGLPDMPIYIDSAVLQNRRVVLGGGNRSSKLLVDPADLRKIPSVQVIEGLGLPR